MMDALVLDLRQRLCQQDAGGRWLCMSCQVPLAEEDPSRCPACAARAEDERRRQEAAERRERWETEQRLRAAQVLEQLPKWRHLKSAEATAACIDRRLLPAAERWTPSMGSLLLLGPSGCGKTTAAGRGLHRLGASRLDARLADPRSLDAKRDLDEFLGIVWTNASALSRALSEHRLGAGQEPELWTTAVQARALVIDELGPEPPHHAGQLFDLVDRRCNEGLPTVLTSGQPLDALELRYGTGLTRRLKQRGLGAIIDCHQAERRRGG